MSSLRVGNQNGIPADDQVTAVKSGKIKLDIRVGKTPNGNPLIINVQQGDYSELSFPITALYQPDKPIFDKVFAPELLLKPEKTKWSEETAEKLLKEAEKETGRKKAAIYLKAGANFAGAANELYGELVSDLITGGTKSNIAKIQPLLNSREEGKKLRTLLQSAKGAFEFALKIYRETNDTKGLQKAEKAIASIALYLDKGELEKKKEIAKNINVEMMKILSGADELMKQAKKVLGDADISLSVPEPNTEESRFELMNEIKKLIETARQREKVNKDDLESTAKTFEQVGEMYVKIITIAGQKEKEGLKDLIPQEIVASAREKSVEAYQKLVGVTTSLANSVDKNNIEEKDAALERAIKAYDKLIGVTDVEEEPERLGDLLTKKAELMDQIKMPQKGDEVTPSWWNEKGTNLSEIIENISKEARVAEVEKSAVAAYNKAIENIKALGEDEEGAYTDRLIELLKKKVSAQKSIQDLSRDEKEEKAIFKDIEKTYAWLIRLYEGKGDYINAAKTMMIQANHRETPPLHDRPDTAGEKLRTKANEMFDDVILKSGKINAWITVGDAFVAKSSYLEDGEEKTGELQGAAGAYGRAYGTLIDAAALEKDPAESAKIFNKAVDVAGKLIQVRKSLGNSDEALGDAYKLLCYASEAIDENAALDAATKAFSEYRKVTEKTKESKPARDRILGKAADTLMLMGELQERLEKSSSLISVSYLTASMLYTNSNRHEEAYLAKVKAKKAELASGVKSPAETVTDTAPIDKKAKARLKGIEGEGLKLLEEGKFKEAASKFEEVAGLAEETGYREIETGATELAGHAWQMVGDETKAMTAFDRAVNLYRVLAIIQQQRARYAVKEARQARTDGKFTNADKKDRAADRALTKVTEYKRGEAKILIELGNIKAANSTDTKSLWRAVDFYESAVEAARGAGDKSVEAEAFIKLGRIWLKLKHPERAIDSFKKIIKLARADKNQAFETEALTGIGDIEMSQGDLKSAERHFNEAYIIFKAIDDKSEKTLEVGYKLALARYEIGVSKAEMEDAKEFPSMSYFIDASSMADHLRIAAKEKGLKGLEARAYNLMGCVEMKMAENFALNRDTGNNAARAIYRFNIAIDSFETSLELYREIGQEDVFVTLYLAKALEGAINIQSYETTVLTEQCGKYNKAIEMYKNVETLFHEFNLTECAEEAAEGKIRVTEKFEGVKKEIKPIATKDKDLGPVIEFGRGSKFPADFLNHKTSVIRIGPGSTAAISGKTIKEMLGPFEADLRHELVTTAKPDKKERLEKLLVLVQGLQGGMKDDFTTFEDAGMLTHLVSLLGGKANGPDKIANVILGLNDANKYFQTEIKKGVFDIDRDIATANYIAEKMRKVLSYIERAKKAAAGVEKRL